MSSKTDYISANFQFLEKIDVQLVELGARAERYALDDPNTSMIKVRQLGELLVRFVASKRGIQADSRIKDQRAVIDELYRSDAVTPEIQSLFHAIRMEGNSANHAMQGHQGEAITLLRHARNIAVWAYRSYINDKLKLGSFAPPTPTSNTDKEAADELARLREENVRIETERRRLEGIAADEKALRKMAEECELSNTLLPQFNRR